MILALDFDGVLHDIDHPVPGRRMGEPLPGTRAALESLKTEGHTLIIHSVRGDKSEHIADWCEYYHIPYDEITNIKPNADWYIDDRGLRFYNWPQMMSELDQIVEAENLLE